MSISSKEKFDLKRLIKELEGYRGRHTELVTVCIPAGYDINKISTHIAQEQGTATNIKSTATRKNVIDALERMIQHLRLYPKTPERGLCCFSGNVSEREGGSDVRVWSIEPPIPLNTRIYRCDKEFILDPLREMLEDKEVYGLVVLDRREADVAYLKGKAIIPLAKASSNVPGKTKAGGQSAARYMRLREDAAKDFYKKVADIVKDQFFENKDLKGILLGGPGPTKHDWLERGFLTNELKQKVIGIKDLSYTGDFGVQELVDLSQDILANEEIAGEKIIMQKFFNLLSTKPNMVTYGEAEVKRLTEMSISETLLLSEELDDKLIEEFEKLAEPTGADVQIISTETREGAQLKAMGKIAAILRYEYTEG